jgi:CRP-like cAMP-binding protein
MDVKVPDCESCSNFESNLFKCLKKENLATVNAGKQFSAYRKGSFLFRAGDPADKFFCVQSGLIRTFKTSGMGREQTFLIKTGGDWVGCRDVLISDFYNHSAICMNEVEACIINKDTLEALMVDSGFQTELLKQMAKSWRDSENQIFSLGTKQIHSKLAEFLVTFHYSNGNSNEITLSITREVIASIIGTTTESVIRALSDFRARDWIDIDKNKIIFKNMQALTSLSEIEERRIYY